MTISASSAFFTHVSACPMCPAIMIGGALTSLAISRIGIATVWVCIERLRHHLRQEGLHLLHLLHLLSKSRKKTLTCVECLFLDRLLNRVLTREARWCSAIVWQRLVKNCCRKSILDAVDNFCNKICSFLMTLRFLEGEVADRSKLCVCRMEESLKVIPRLLEATMTFPSQKCLLKTLCSV